jgi:predicted PurR-regulated permease PerM
MFIVIILLGIFGIIALAILSIFPDLINSLSINISPVYYYMDDGYQKTVSEIIRVQNKLEYLTTTCLYGQYHSYMYAIQDNYPQSHINYHHEWFQRTITDIAHEKRYLKTLIDKLNTRV